MRSTLFSLVTRVGMFVTACAAGFVALTAGAYAADAAHIIFVSGKVEIAGKPVLLNAAVQEGNEITTGADGYIYLKTVDEGFFILRPNSRARIDSYHVDAADPANTRIKLELLSGVARSISGHAVKQARQNFRFNTPVAAIGVRGTDFTVYTDQNVSRVAVISGGVVVSGFTASCSPFGIGPCEGNVSRELFARQSGQLLQIAKGQGEPQLIQGNGVSPDNIAPPRPDEPNGKGSSNASTSTKATPDLSLDPKKGADLAQLLVPPPKETPPIVVEPTPPPVTPLPPAIPEPRQVIWGRWQTVMDQAPTTDMSKQISTKINLIAMNSYFALSQTKGTEWQVPTTGSMGFSLKESEAYILDESKATNSVAKLENGRMQVDFAKASFSTGFDLVSSANERFKLQNQGSVGTDGRLYGGSVVVGNNNMTVNGVLTPENGGAAAYLFQTRLDDKRTASGITFWSKQ